MHVSQGRCPSAAAVPLPGASWPHPPQELLLPVALRTATGGREEEGDGNYDANNQLRQCIRLVLNIKQLLNNYNNYISVYTTTSLQRSLQSAASSLECRAVSGTLVPRSSTVPCSQAPPEPTQTLQTQQQQHRVRVKEGGGGGEALVGVVPLAFEKRVSCW